MSYLCRIKLAFLAVPQGSRSYRGVGLTYVFFSVLIFCPSTSAQSYLGIAGSYSWERFSTQHGLDYDNTPLWGILAGYRLDNDLAAEVNFERTLRDVDVDIPDRSGDVSINTLTTGIRAFQPFYTRIDAGLLYATARHLNKAPDGTGACVDVGIGYEHNLPYNLKIGVEAKYLWGLFNVADYQYFLPTLRLTYPF